MQGLNLKRKSAVSNGRARRVLKTALGKGEIVAAADRRLGAKLGPYRPRQKGDGVKLAPARPLVVPPPMPEGRRVCISRAGVERDRHSMDDDNICLFCDWNPEKAAVEAAAAALKKSAAAKAAGF